MAAISFEIRDQRRTSDDPRALGVATTSSNCGFSIRCLTCQQMCAESKPLTTVDVGSHLLLPLSQEILGSRSTASSVLMGSMGLRPSAMGTAVPDILHRRSESVNISMVVAVPPMRHSREICGMMDKTKKDHPRFWPPSFFH